MMNIYGGRIEKILAALDGEEIDKSLILAIKRGNLDEIIAILNNGGDINRIFYFGVTPLLYAFYDNCSEQVIRLLIDAGANVNVCDFDNMYPLMYALSYRDGNHEIVSWLIEAGANLLAVDTHNNTPLLLALQRKSGHRFVHELISAGSNVNAVNMFYLTPLLSAIANGCDARIVSELISFGADVNFKNFFTTPLHEAVVRVASPEIIILLINAGADVNVRVRGKCPLTNISCKRTDCDKGYCINKENIQVLLENRADIKVTTSKGNTVLHIVNCVYLINLLLIRYGLSLNVRNNEGETPLLYAMLVNNFEKVHDLLLLGADCNIPDVSLNTPLHYIENVFSENNVEDIVNILIYHGADLNTKNIDGNTPLDIVVDVPFHDSSLVRLDCVKAIIKHLLLFSNENIFKLLRSYSNDWRCFIMSFVKEFMVDLHKMMCSFINDNLTFFHFCNLKRTKRCRFVDISFIQYNYNYGQIQKMFPIYHDFIIVRMKDNKIEKCYNDLMMRLDRLHLKPLSSVEDNITNFVKLNYYTLRFICGYLSHKEIHHLFLASML